MTIGNLGLYGRDGFGETYGGDLDDGVVDFDGFVDEGVTSIGVLEMLGELLLDGLFCEM